jgi:hypothetical protein
MNIHEWSRLNVSKLVLLRIFAPAAAKPESASFSVDLINIAMLFSITS